MDASSLFLEGLEDVSSNPKISPTERDIAEGWGDIDGALVSRKF